MSVEYIAAITRRYEALGYPAYKWYRANVPPPWSSLKKPMSDVRLGVLCTAGTYVAGQVAYYYKDDTSIRAIPKDTPTDRIRFSHITENYLPNARKDPNCVFPIDTLRQMEAEGEVGEIADDMLSCMGGVYSQRRVNEELCPAIAETFASQKVDAALLIPL
jgi:D-proline reductase (dithiol) PrdB